MDEQVSESLGRIEALLGAHLGLTLASERISLASEDYAEVETRTIRLLHHGGFSQGRIADLLGVSQPTVSRRLKDES